MILSYSPDGYILGYFDPPEYGENQVYLKLITYGIRMSSFIYLQQKFPKPFFVPYYYVVARKRVKTKGIRENIEQNVRFYFYAFLQGKIKLNLKIFLLVLIKNNARKQASLL